MLKSFPYIILVYLLVRAPLYGFFDLYRYGTMMNVFEAGLFGYMLTVKGFKQVLLQRINLLWILLVAFHLINYVIQVPADRPQSLIFRVTTCAFLMIQTEFLYLRRPATTLKWLCGGFFIFIMIAFNMVSVDADFENRLKGDAMHPNLFAQTAGCGLLVLAYTKYVINLSWGRTILLTIPGFVVILGCGSRNGLALFFIYCAAIFIAKQFENEFSGRKIFKLLFIFVLLYIIGCLILNNTMVGERLLNTEKQTEEYTNLQTGIPILDLMGDRGIFYYIGWMNFLDNPISGIGLYNFADYNNYPVPVHSEYMIHLAEGGLIGISIFLIFVFIMINGLYGNFKISKTPQTFILLILFFSYVFVCISARCFDTHCFYPLLGLCTASIIKRKSNCHDKNKKRITRVYPC